MTKRTRPKFETKRIDDLVIDDEGSFRHVSLYADLKEVLRRDAYEFRILPKSQRGRWDRALMLNLTFWDGAAGGDVLVDDRIAADVVAHVAWHHLAARHLAGPKGKQSASALFLGEAIASAFDVYLVGRLLGHASKSSFLETQVPAMAEAAREAGLSEEGFESLLEGIAREPERAFEALRRMLCDAMNALVDCTSMAEALASLQMFDSHRFGPLLHRYEISNWLLYARAHTKASRGADPRVQRVDGALRGARDSLEWLMTAWVAPARGNAAPARGRATARS